MSSEEKSAREPGSARRCRDCSCRNTGRPSVSSRGPGRTLHTHRSAPTPGPHSPVAHHSALASCFLSLGGQPVNKASHPPSRSRLPWAVRVGTGREHSCLAASEGRGAHTASTGHSGGACDQSLGCEDRRVRTRGAGRPHGQIRTVRSTSERYKHVSCSITAETEVSEVTTAQFWRTQLSRALRQRES